MIIGVTGGLSSGKSTVTRFFKKLGLKVIDADKLVHRILDYKARRNIRKIVLRNKKEFKKLERLIHPIILKQIKEKIKDTRKHNYNLVVDAPLLIETGLNKLVDFLVVVRADRKTQIKRANKSLNLKRQDAINIIKRQMQLKEKIKRADFVIDNNGSLIAAKRQVNNIWKKINGPAKNLRG